jgi:hypothetical protein
MPGSGTLTLSGMITGYPFGQRTVNIAWPLTAALDDSFPASLSIGDNQISVPSGASMVAIEPPDANTVVITLKGGVSDTGIALHKTQACWLSLDSSTVGFYLNIPSLLTGPVQITFF